VRDRGRAGRARARRTDEHASLQIAALGASLQMMAACGVAELQR
jgi:hypothetical protein